MPKTPTPSPRLPSAAQIQQVLPVNEKTARTRRLRYELLEGLADAGCDIGEEIKRLLDDPEFPTPSKADLILRTLPFVYAARKAIDPQQYMTIDQATEMLEGVSQLFTAAITQHISNPVERDKVLAAVKAEVYAGSHHGPQGSLE